MSRFDEIDFRDDEARADHTALKWTVWRAFVLSFPVGIVLLFVGLAVAGLFPPLPEHWDALRVEAYFDDHHTLIRIGGIIALFGSTLLLPTFVLISREIRRIEGLGPLLAPLQLAGAILLIVFTQLILLLWITATLRAEFPAAVVGAMDDYCWIVWTMLVPTVEIQFLCIACASFMDPRHRPLWPRWAAWANLTVVPTQAGGMLTPFFKHGPFSWNGLIGYWMPVVVFGIVMCMNCWLLWRYGQREREFVDHPAAGDTPAQPVVSVPRTG